MKLTTASSDRSMQSAQLELADRIGRLATDEGRTTVQPGLVFNRKSVAGERIHAVSEPSFCVIAQGSKDVLLADEVFHYDPAHYLVTTVPLPVSAEVVEATPKVPYLSVRLVLDPAVVTSVMVESGRASQGENGGVKGIDVSPLDTGLLDAVLRLVRLIEQPADYPILSPLIIREIVYRLLKGEQCDRLRHLARPDSQSPRMAQAVQILREGFDQPLRIEHIAKQVGMSTSGFHAHFKSATAMTPLQFQKEVRLQEARRLMLSQNLDAAEAGYNVGYEDPSYFSRDYKRHFGAPPKRDLARLRELDVPVPS